MKLYQREECPDSRRVRARMTELLLSYTVVNVPASPAARTDLDEATGQRTIPVLVTDGDHAVCGADEILAYLDKAFGGEQPKRSSDELPDAGVREP